MRHGPHGARILAVEDDEHIQLSPRVSRTREGHAVEWRRARSFWLVDNLAAQGRLDEAMALYESLCGRAGGLGLLPEEVDPTTGAFLGNHPQAFSHVGVVSSGMNLARLTRRRQ